jgi:hypothetical membrane protein
MSSIGEGTSVRSARLGGFVLLVAAVQFVLGMTVTQLGWTTPYSLRTNYISDLGAVSCGYYPTVDPRYICSPWHDVFNTSIVILGLLTLLAVYLIRRAIPPGRIPSLGLILLALSGVGAIGVGLSPEDVNLSVHTLSALLSFVAGNTALILLGASMWRDAQWGEGFGAFGAVLGAIGWIALLLFITQHWGPFGVGGVERAIVAPTLLWAAVIGYRLIRAPPRTPTTPAPVSSGATG